jgi:anti-sigma-K factor RskA
MTPHTDIQAEIRQFLLGTLSEDARQKVEERLMTEDGFLEELTLAESGLMDDYVCERLGDDERAEFERNFLSTEERRRQLSFTLALGRYADAHAPASAAATDVAGPVAGHGPSPRPAPTFGERLRAFWAGLSAPSRAGLALACVAVIAVALWFARPASPPRFNPAFPALTLAPGSGDRATGPETPNVRLAPGGGLRLKLTLRAESGPATAYRAEVVTSTNRVVADEAAERDGRSVSAVVPEGRLVPGQYAVRLYAVGADRTEPPLETYLFDVISPD